MEKTMDGGFLSSTQSRKSVYFLTTHTIAKLEPNFHNKQWANFKEDDLN